MSASLNYSKTIAGFKSVIDPLGFGQVSSPININSNFPDETFTAFARFSKRVKKLQFTANANVSMSNSFNQFRNDSRESKSLTQSYRGGVRTNFRDWPNFEVGYRVSINDFDNGGTEQVSYTHQPSISFDARFWEYFTFNAAWDFFDYSNKARTIENNYSFLNANLYYQKGDSPWEFQLQANNILDNRSTNSDSFDQQTNITSTSQYFVLPRIMMFVVKYDL